MSAETRLWQAVLYQAVDDAIHGAALGGSVTTKLRSIEEARSFLTKPSRDLDLVCSSAGFDMTVIVERMRKLIADAPPVEELIAGKVARRMAEREAKERAEAMAKPKKTTAARCPKAFEAKVSQRSVE
jgi:hypothetical protein